jgi:hypothetical protein
MGTTLVAAATAETDTGPDEPPLEAPPPLTRLEQEIAPDTSRHRIATSLQAQGPGRWNTDGLWSEFNIPRFLMYGFPNAFPRLLISA